MREIKLRAWAPSQSTILPMFAIDMQDGKMVVGIWKNSETRVIKPDQDAVFMQYTGLKDKNGVEIYEGDIVEMTNPNYAVPAGPYWSVKQGDKRVVKRLESGFSLIRSWEFDTPNLAGNVANYDFWNHHRLFEVIGNIYENPERLEANQ